jgi:hypothetical protein
MCSKKFVAAIPHWLPAYEKRNGNLEKHERDRLLAISPATVDRLLRKRSRAEPRAQLSSRQQSSGAACQPGLSLQIERLKFTIPKDSPELALLNLHFIPTTRRFKMRNANYQWEPARTQYERLLDSIRISPDRKAALQREHDSLDPFELLAEAMRSARDS